MQIVNKQVRRTSYFVVSAGVAYICTEWILKKACVPSGIIRLPDWYCGILRFALYAQIVGAIFGILTLVVRAATRKT